MGRRISPRGIRKHRLYTTSELARALGCCKETVRRWVRNGLYAIEDVKPILIRGEDAVAYLKSRRSAKQKCAIDECYCVRCKRPTRPSFAAAAITLNVAGRPELRGPCEACGTPMMKPVKRDAVSGLSAILNANHQQAG